MDTEVHPLMKLRSLVFAGAAAAALAAPSGALAVDSTTTVSGTAGTELSLAVTTPGAMTFTPSTDGTTSTTATITSTASSWTLSILEAADAVTAVAGDGKLGDTLGNKLASPLEWKLGTASAYTNLSGTAATVGTGTLTDTRTVDFRQQIGATEDVTAGTAYSAVVTLRVQ